MMRDATGLEEPHPMSMPQTIPWTLEAFSWKRWVLRLAMRENRLSAVPQGHVTRVAVGILVATACGVAACKGRPPRLIVASAPVRESLVEFTDRWMRRTT